MAEPTNEERERFEQVEREARLVDEILALRDAEPWKQFENDVFELLHAWVRGGNLHGASFGSRRRLRCHAGTDLKFAMQRLDREFDFAVRSSFAIKEAANRDRLDQNELAYHFVTRVAEIDKLLLQQDIRDRDRALAEAAAETYALARHILGDDHKRLSDWVPVGPRSLQIRYSKFLRAWVRAGYAPPAIGGDGRAVLSKSLADFRAKRGAPATKAKRRY